MNYTNCPHCGGWLRSETLGWICEKCRGFIDMQGNFHEHVEKPFMPPMTNADKIRAMNDYELSVFLSQVRAMVYRADLSVVAYSAKDMADNLAWLRKPVKEDA